ncbi:MAG: glycosyltransferase family 1 protein [Clostridia bacterium]|nr:glycosyltransferase family 1 protein [Clostridia bacterium]
MSVKRLLCCMSCMDVGGAETFLMKQYRRLDREKYQMDFCVNVEERGAYDDEIEALGGRIFRIPPKTKDPVACLTSLRKIVKDNGYEAVFSSSAKSGVALDLLAAKAGGAKRLIHRSSSAGDDGGRVERLLGTVIAPLTKIVPDVKLAPSVLAAEFCFGKGCVEKGRAHILNNGIDTDIFSYSDEFRAESRKTLGLDDEFILIHVGRFVGVKNHDFLIDVFEQVANAHPNSKLVLVGVGDLEEKIRTKVQKKELSDKVLFLGARKDIPALLSAADVLVFPSFYEGMPNAVIEAQALSLQCIVSDKITAECRITDLVEFLPLGNAKQWAEKILPLADGYERKNMTEHFKKIRYDAQSTLDDFVKYCFGE